MLLEEFLKLIFFFLFFLTNTDTLFLGCTNTRLYW